MTNKIAWVSAQIYKTFAQIWPNAHGAYLICTHIELIIVSEIFGKNVMVIVLVWKNEPVLALWK